MSGLDFGEALHLLLAGERVARKGWNGEGMFLFMIPKWDYTDGKNDNYVNRPFIAMKTSTSEVVPWLASQTDLLSCDWYEVTT